MRTVCFCNSNIPWGGGEAWHLTAAISLADRGWRVLLLCHPKSELFSRASGHTSIRTVPLALSRLSFLNPIAKRRLIRLFRRERVDSLIMNLPADLKVAGPAARAAGVEHIVYRRGSALPVRNSALNRHLYGSILTRLIVNSEATRAQVLVNNPDLIPAERITVLPNGIDIPAFDDALDRARLSLPEWAERDAAAPGPCRPFIIGNAGRLNRQKGQHLLLHLGRRLMDKGLPFRLVIAGSGEREAELKGLAKDLGIADQTVFTGFMDDLGPFWAGIDLFVLTSLWEGFGYVLLEAMLAQKPVFAFAVSNIPELITDGKNGRLFPLPEADRPESPEQDIAPAKDAEASGCLLPHSLDRVAEAVLALAAHPEDGYRMGLAGRDFARQFSQETCMDVLENLLS